MTSRYDTCIVSKRIAIRYDFSESLQLYRVTNTFVHHMYMNALLNQVAFKHVIND